jgi:hypothetical protein
MMLLALAIIGIGAIIMYLLHRRKVELAAQAAKSGSSHGGAALVSAAQEIPVYGQIVKAVATVGRPVNRTLNKVNKGISSGLHHIPVVGGYLAKPNELLGSGVYKLNDWLGLN